MKIIQKTFPIWACFLSAPFSAWAGSGDDIATSEAGRSRLNVQLATSTTCDYNEVNISLEYVRISQDGINWTTIPLNSSIGRVNLLSLTNGALLDLGEASLLPGTYRQIMMAVKDNGSDKPWDNSVILSGSTVEIPLKTHSSGQESYEIAVPFTVQEGKPASLVLDFDACKSISLAGRSGRYILKPVVIPIAKDASGSISGKTSAYAKVFAEQQSTSGPVVVQGTLADSTGAFTLAFMERGTVDVVIVPPPNDSLATSIVQNVPVVPGATTSIGNVDPAASSINNVSGTVAVKTSGAKVAANLKAEQMISSTGRSYVTTSTITDTGSYNIPLPMSGPWLGTYRGRLPISFTEDTKVSDSGIHTITATDGLGHSLTKQVNVRGGTEALDFSLGQAKNK
jgi:Domain of unknown function (DUF4382)